MPKGDWLGEFEVCTLLAVAQLGEEAYGLRVRQHLEAATGRRLAIGAVYNTLARLKEKGLLRSHADAPRPVQGGRTRTCFHLTAAGTRALTHSTSVLTRMIAGWNPKSAK
jgi:PadR family transcriptional regulator, regulatory protein PadR